MTSGTGWFGQRSVAFWTVTDGVDEETVVVSIEGRRVATLHANRDDPITTKYVRATNPGSYSYVLDAVLIWTGNDGVLQRTVVTGSGDVYIRNGVRLDVYNHADSDGDMTLSLQTATG